MRTEGSLFDELAAGIEAHYQRQALSSLSFSRFAREVLGIRLWKQQRELGRLIDAGYRRIAGKWGHGTGKTLAGAVAVCRWLACGGPGTVVVTSAPTNRQVEEVLWREVRRLWSGSPLLRGLAVPLQRKIEIDTNWAAYGFATNEPQRFQGWHAPRLRFLIDEANAFPEFLFTSIDSCIAGGDAQLVLLGNAIVPCGYFYRCFGDRDPDPEQPRTAGTAKLTVSARAHPNVRTGRHLIPGAVSLTWVRDFEERYGSAPDVVKARIDAEFPDSMEDGLVPLAWLRAAREVQPRTLRPVVYGLDVARFGSNLSVLTRLEGQRLAWQKCWAKASTTLTADRVRAIFASDGADRIVVDDDGVGGGVTDQLRAYGLPVEAFHAGQPATQPDRFANRITEAWWCVREGFEHGLWAIDQPEGELELQLASRRYSLTPRQTLRLEPKDEFTQRTGMASPDRADSFALAAWQTLVDWTTWFG